MRRSEFRSMGSRVLALSDGPEESARAALDLVPVWFEEWEAAFSRFRPDSELSRLNRSTGEVSTLSPAMGEVVSAALLTAEETDGLVQPLLLDAIEAAGYARSFDAANPPAVAGRLPVGRNISDWRAVRLSTDTGRIFLPRGGRLDLGGFVKGWAADTAAARLSRNGPALVDAGGDIAAPGVRADGSPWPVGVTDPFSPGGILCTLALADAGVATSGRDYRKWEAGGRSAHHLIDPRTMLPAESDVLTATVIAPGAARAEAAAKAALILGSDGGIAWLDARPELAGMLVLSDRRIVYSRRFSEFVWNEMTVSSQRI